jgi:hypothetical protein
VTVLEPAVRELSPGFAVRRALPVAQRRTVGPFVFFDHFGPVALARAATAETAARHLLDILLARTPPADAVANPAVLTRSVPRG